MLSFIYSLARDFEAGYGERANMLYINRMHFDHLRRHFSDPDDMETMMAVLGMTIMISSDAVNPHLARIARPAPERRLAHLSAGMRSRRDERLAT